MKRIRNINDVYVYDKISLVKDDTRKGIYSMQVREQNTSERPEDGTLKIDVRIKNIGFIDVSKSNIMIVNIDNRKVVEPIFDLYHKIKIEPTSKRDQSMITQELEVALNKVLKIGENFRAYICQIIVDSKKEIKTTKTIYKAC